MPDSHPDPTAAAPPSPIRVLHLEDNPADAELVIELLAQANLPCNVDRVETQAAFAAALRDSAYDLILSDFSLPSYNGLAALRLAREIQPEKPFIFVSGTIGEETAVESLRNGATDYILKNRMERLPAAVLRALRESRERAGRRTAEEKISEQAALLDNAQDAICLTDMSQQILYWNRSAERLYGWSAAQAIGRNSNELLFQGDLSRPLEALKQLIRAGRWQGELTQVDHNQQRIIVESRWTLMRDPKGNPKSILVINTDITEKRHIEAQLLRNQRMESIGALAGGIAHDLNNMLAPIMMAADMLQIEGLPPASRALLETVKLSAQRGSEMVKQILSFARGVPGERTVIEVRHLVNEIAKLARETFPRSIQIKAAVPRNAYGTFGNVTQLHQVLMNLLVNARDAMPEGGTIEIKIENVVLHEKTGPLHNGSLSGPFLKLQVADSGKGIPEALHDRIFTPFFTTKEVGKGTGLGLSTVLTIVKNHEGMMEVDSEVGRGSRFTLYLPAYQGAPETPREKASRDDLLGQSELLLVVDDEIAILEMTKVLLESCNYRVLTAKDGVQALKIVRETPGLDVLITDMMMPIMDGPALLREVHQFNPKIRTIGVSGLSSESRLSAAEKIRLDAFLTKPFAMETLLTAVRKVLAHSSSGAG